MRGEWIEQGEGGLEIAQVGRRRSGDLRRSHGDEMHVAAGGVGHRAAEAEPSAGEAGGQELGEPRFEEGCLARIQAADLVDVVVDADHLVTEAGHAHCTHGAEVSASDHRHFHVASEGRNVHSSNRSVQHDLFDNMHNAYVCESL